jgi:hypothetical protein
MLLQRKWSKEPQEQKTTASWKTKPAAAIKQQHQLLAKTKGTAAGNKQTENKSPNIK